MTQKELSEFDARVQEDKFSKFHGNLISAPVRKDSYLPESCGDLNTDISSPKTKTLLSVEKCRVSQPVRRPAGQTSAELCLIHLNEFNSIFNSRESVLSMTVASGARVASPGLTQDCSAREVVTEEVSRTYDAALLTQAATEVDFEWKKLPDLMGSLVDFSQKEEVDYFWVRISVFDPGICKKP